VTGMDGDVAFRGALGGDATTFELDLAQGGARLSGLRVDGLALRLEAQGPVLRLPTVTGTLYGGALSGRFRRGGERVAFRGDARVTGLDLAAYAADHARPGLEGRIDAEVQFRNPTGTADGLEGSGKASVTGAAVRVPFVTAAARAVNRTLLGAATVEGEFQDGALEFDLRGSRVLVRDLHFAGPHVALLLGARLVLEDGEGVIDARDGRLDLVISPRVELGLLDYEPTGLFERIFGLAQFMVRRLRIQGTTRNPRTSWQILPGEIDEELRARPRPIGRVRRFGPEPG